jgi:hypothetical protein
VRLARTISFFMAAGSIPVPQTLNLPQPRIRHTNTFRTSTRSKAPITAPRSTAATQPTVIDIPSPSKQVKRMVQTMHDDLEAVMDESVFRALDAYANFPVKERERVLNLCKSSNGSSSKFFNATISAAYNHQIALTLATGDFFDAPNLATPMAEGTASAMALTCSPPFKSSKGAGPRSCLPSLPHPSLVARAWTPTGQE